MVLTEDSRPFTVLRKGAEEFNALFNEGIENCLSTLDCGISHLLREPDDLGGTTTSAKRLSAYMEFSKAKYDLFVQMRELFEKFERDCIEQLSEMKEMFLENVEIFLAGTKLEIKLPSETFSQIEKQKSPISKVSCEDSPTASQGSSLYPKLIDSAKKQFSRISSFLPNTDASEIIDDDDEIQQFASVSTPARQNKSSKRIANVSPLIMQHLTAIEKAIEESAIIDISEESDEEPAVIEPREEVKITTKRGRKPAVSTPVSEKKILVSTPGRKTRTPRSKAITSEDSQQTKAVRKTPKSVHFSSDIESNTDSEIQKSPKDFQFSVGMDIHEDLDVYSPDVSLSRTTPRRKTAVLSRVANDIAETDLTPDISRGKSKRKTIAGSVLGDTVAPSPKRLKMGRRSNIMPSTSGEEDEPMDSNFLASDGASEQENYSPWTPLSDISGSVPAQPGIYELKVAAAKKPAYIGGCDSLRQKLTLHKLKQNSGHKHLDKFIERNLSNILVRYEQLPSVAEAKSEEKIRVKAFVNRFKNPPAYN